MKLRPLSLSLSLSQVSNVVFVMSAAHGASVTAVNRVGRPWARSLLSSRAALLALGAAWALALGCALDVSPALNAWLQVRARTFVPPDLSRHLPSPPFDASTPRRPRAPRRRGAQLAPWPARRGLVLAALVAADGAAALLCDVAATRAFAPAVARARAAIPLGRAATRHAQALGAIATFALQVAGRYRGELAKEAARDAKRRAAERKAASGGARRAAAAEAS